MQNLLLQGIPVPVSDDVYAALSHAAHVHGYSVDELANMVLRAQLKRDEEERRRRGVPRAYS